MNSNATLKIYSYFRQKLKTILTSGETVVWAEGKTAIVTGIPWLDVKTCRTSTGEDCLCKQFPLRIGFNFVGPAPTCLTPLLPDIIVKLAEAGSGGVNGLLLLLLLLLLLELRDEETTPYWVGRLGSGFLLFVLLATRRDGGGLSWQRSWSRFGLFWITAWQIW